MSGVDVGIANVRACELYWVWFGWRAPFFWGEPLADYLFIGCSKCQIGLGRLVVSCVAFLKMAIKSFKWCFFRPMSSPLRASGGPYKLRLLPTHVHLDALVAWSIVCSCSLGCGTLCGHRLTRPLLPNQAFYAQHGWRLSTSWPSDQSEWLMRVRCRLMVLPGWSCQ